MKPVHLPEVGSTSDWIAERLSTHGVERLVAVAERQTNGKGRGGREWVSPPFVNVAASVAWKMPGSVDPPGLVTIAAGVALAECAREVCGVAAMIKYPNDLYVNGRKAGGILTERKVCGADVWAVIGVGVNVNTEAWMFPEDIGARATSLMIEAGRPVLREKLLASFVNKLEERLDSLANSGLDGILERSRQLSCVLGHEVTAEDAGETVRGVAVDIDNSGALLVKTRDGVVRRIISGETSVCAQNIRLAVST